MSYFIDICLICLEHSTNLILIRSLDKNGIIIEDKLKYILPKHEFNSNIPKYICVKCRNNLRYDYDFKQKCLQNITTYEKYAQQVTTKDGSNKYLFVIVRPNFVYEDGYNINFSEWLTEENNQKIYLDKRVLRGIKQYRCQNCNKNCRNYEGVEKHELECNKSFQNSQNTKPYTCKICKKKVKELRTLKRHKLLHSGENPYTCKICKKPFTKLSHLKYHELIHSDEKPFTCEVCNKSFRRSDHLKRHKRIHTNEKLFTC